MPRLPMENHPSSSRSFEAEHSLSQASSWLAVSGATELDELPLIERRPLSPKSTWLSDTTDLVVLSCYLLFIIASIVLFALVFRVHLAITPASSNIPGSLPIYISQKVVGIFSVHITTAVMMVIGKRYVLFKLAGGGLRSRSVAIYSDPSIWNLVKHWASHCMEWLPPVLLAALGLASVTGWTVNDILVYGPSQSWMTPLKLSGPLNPGTASLSRVLAASEKLAIVMSHLCLGEVDVTPELPIQVTLNASVSTDHPMGQIYYPPLPYGQSERDIVFSYSTTMNVFNISMPEQLSSIPSTAQNLTCTNNTIVAFRELWLAGSDNQTLSIIIVDGLDNPSIVRFNATAVIAGGTLFSTGNYAGFALNGTSWPNVMTGTQWAQDITTIICNATSASGCGKSQSVFDFAYGLTPQYSEASSLRLYQIVSSTLNMVLGAYSSALLPADPLGTGIIPITIYDSMVRTDYKMYILAANIIVSLLLLLIAVVLRLASPLGLDFINSTRLLLDPLKKPELFNASLNKTVEALGDPYMRVKGNRVLLLPDRGGRRNAFGPVQEELQEFPTQVRESGLYPSYT